MNMTLKTSLKFGLFKSIMQMEIEGGMGASRPLPKNLQTQVTDEISNKSKNAQKLASCEDICFLYFSK